MYVVITKGISNSQYKYVTFHINPLILTESDATVLCSCIILLSLTYMTT